MSACAWVTLATNDSYSLGALVLAHSLRSVGTAHQLAVMVTPGVTPTMREHLQSVFDLVHDVNVLDSNDASNLALLARPELGITFTKLHCWSLTQYSKCVFMDADTLVLQACDELFDREELSAAPDVGWPDCFNSGVFVFRPSADTFKNLIDFALSTGSFDGGDQGLLNLFFSNWATQDSSRRLPFIYNMCSTAVYSYLPAFKQFGKDAKIVHFIGQMKPWLLELDTQSGLVTPSSGYEHLRPVLQQWWSMFLAEVLPKLQPDMRDDEQLSMVYDSHELMDGVRRYDPRSFESAPDPEIRQVFIDPWESFQPPSPVSQEEVSHPSIGQHEDTHITHTVESTHTYSLETRTEETRTEEHHHHIDDQSTPRTELSHTETVENHQPPLSPLPTETRNDGDGAGSIIIASADSDGGGMAGALAQLSIGSPRSEQQVALEQHWRRQAWERGNADYLGKDSFEKIWEKIQSTLQGVQPPGLVEAPPPPPPVQAPPVEAPPPSVPTEPTEPTAQEAAAPEPAPASVAPTSPPPEWC